MNWLKPVIAIQWRKPLIMEMAAFLISRLFSDELPTKGTVGIKGQYKLEKEHPG